MLNPCCCITPRIGAFIFAIIDLCWAVPYVYYSIRNLLDHGVTWNIVVNVVIGVILLLLAITLLLGAIKQDAEKVRMWLTCWLIFVVVMLCLSIFNVYEGQSTVKGFNVEKEGGLIFVLFCIYEIWVVYAYLIELRAGPSGLTYCPSQIV